MPGLSDFDIEAICRALSDPRRFQIRRQIASQDSTACAQLLERVPITAPTLSHHRKELEAARLITTTHRSKFVELAFCREIWKAYSG